MKLFSSKKRVAAIGALTAATLVGGGMAVAYWTAGGAGAGGATTGSVADFTIVNQTTTGDLLAPDGPIQTARFNVHNPGTGTQYVNQVTVSVANSDGSAWVAVSGCSADDFIIGGEQPGTPHIIDVDENVGTGLNSSQQSVTIQMWNDTANPQDACQGVSVPLHYAVS
jgi:hypothetical protein